MTSSIYKLMSMLVRKIESPYTLPMLDRDEGEVWNKVKHNMRKINDHMGVLHPPQVCKDKKMYSLNVWTKLMPDREKPFIIK